MISGRISHAVRIKTLRSTPTALLEALDDAPDDQPDSIATSIGRWRLLENVPFNYLVADPVMLPPESIRFFQIDNLWIDSLIDGALSLGSATSDDVSTDQALGSPAHASGRVAATTRRAERLGETNPAPSGDPTSPGIASGFLLRSGAVSGWPGIEAEARDTSSTKLAILRMTHLRDDVLFCLFDGPLDTLLLHPPPEGLHFGFDDDGKKPLRFTTDVSGAHAAGDPIIMSSGAPITVSPTFRDDSNRRVLNIAKLKIAIQDGLQRGNDVNPLFTAAEFALEMTTGVDVVEFKRTV